jgi:hypothetical protein
MTSPFDYDVFLSFSILDEQIAKPIWQELSTDGLRVFWSDETLKTKAGISWYEVIEKSLERSKHLLLICSENSMNSEWVKREFRAFYDLCYSSDKRRLIPVLTRGFLPSSLPFFLRELQAMRLDSPQFFEEVLPMLGGVDIEKLQRENQCLQEQVDDLTDKNLRLQEEVTSLMKENEYQKKELDNDRKRMQQLDKDRETASRQAAQSESVLKKLWDRYPKQKDIPQRSVGKAARLIQPCEDETQTVLYVHNLSKIASEAELTTLFSKAGEVISVRKFTNDVSPGRKNLAVVVMSTHEGALRALKMFNGQQLHGNALNVTFSRSLE